MASMRIAQRLGSRPFTSRPYAPIRPAVACRAGDEGGDIRGSKMENALFGDNFGARDPTAGELATNFGDTGLTHWDTEHIIKPPDRIKQFVGLTSKSCQENLPTLALLQPQQVDLLKNQVPGWRVETNAAGAQCIRQDWKGKDTEAAQEISAKLSQVATEEGHDASLAVIVSGTDVSLELSTVSLGGLSENDFIVAAKVNEVRVVDLVAKRKQRFWA